MNWFVLMHYCIVNTCNYWTSVTYVHIASIYITQTCMHVLYYLKEKLLWLKFYNKLWKFSLFAIPYSLLFMKVQFSWMFSVYHELDIFTDILFITLHLIINTYRFSITMQVLVYNIHSTTACAYVVWCVSVKLWWVCEWIASYSVATSTSFLVYVMQGYHMCTSIYKDNNVNQGRVMDPVERG